MSCPLWEYVTPGVSKFLSVKSVEAQSHEGTQTIDLRSLWDLSRPLDQAEGEEVSTSKDCHSGKWKTQEWKYPRALEHQISELVESHSISTHD
jgi:hypothetical protein